MGLQTLLTKAEVKASELNPYLHDKAIELVKLANANGYDIMITQGYRSIAEQDALYAQGRTIKCDTCKKSGATCKHIVTNAKGGSSNHNYRLAFDIAILNSDGSVDWNTESKYRAVGKLGQSIGLDWGGIWKDFVDLPHFEYTYGLSISQLKSGAKILDYPQGYTKEATAVANSVINNGVTHERIYVANGKLNTVPLKADSSFDYSVSATDVRYIKFPKDKYTLKLVWEKGAKVSDLVKKYGADYGFNAPFFWDGNPIADCKIGNTILSQGYDTVGGAQQTKWHGFAWKNGQPVIGQLNINDNYSTDGFLFKTTPLLLNGQGAEVWDWYRVQEGTASDIGKSGSSYVRAQRTVIGTDAEGSLHLAVGDGRTKWDRGMDLEEMAKYMASKGCMWALNVDGGSSSVIADKTGSLGENKGAEERAVNHAVLVFLKKEEVPTTPPQGGTTVEQWKLDSLLKLSQYKQVNGESMIDYDTWKDKLNEPVPTWLMVELIKRVLEKG